MLQLGTPRNIVGKRILNYKMAIDPLSAGRGKEKEQSRKHKIRFESLRWKEKGLKPNTKKEKERSKMYIRFKLFIKEQ